MSWYRYLILFLLIFLSTCSAKKTINQDFVYLVAVDCELQKRYNCSALNYAALYDESKNDKFLKKSISYALMSKNFFLMQRYIDEIEKKSKTSTVYARFLIPYYVEKREYQKARLIASKNLKKENTLQNQKISLALEKNPNSNNSLKILKNLYNESGDKKYAQEIISIYITNKDEKNLREFLEKSRSDDELLMDLYGNFKNYKKAENLALKLYEKDKNPMFLIKAALFLYEPNEKKFLNGKNLKELEKVFDRFERSVFEVDSPIYYNYYGYILIEHDKDIKKGLELVSIALKKEPKNSYYIDSLSWGYYKNGECKRAFDILSPLKDDKQEDIQIHLKVIKKCLENR